MFYNRRVYNIPIRFIESTRQYALGREKNGEEVRQCGDSNLVKSERKNNHVGEAGKQTSIKNEIDSTFNPIFRKY